MILFLNATKQVFVPKKQQQNTSKQNPNTYFLKNTNKTAWLSLLWLH
jgi:hypothetical protein